MTKEIMAGPLPRKARPACDGDVGADHRREVGGGLRRGVRHPRGEDHRVVRDPAAQRAADPPNVGAFSTTTQLSPCFAAVSAAVIPAAPEPITTTSYVPSRQVGRVRGTWQTGREREPGSRRRAEHPATRRAGSGGGSGGVRRGGFGTSHRIRVRGHGRALQPGEGMGERAVAPGSNRSSASRF